MLELWDLRNFKKFRNIDWEGPKAEQTEQDMEEEKASEDTKNEEEEMNFNRQNPAPFIYSASFNNETNVIMAAGAGANQVRLFDYDTGNVVCVI